MIWCVTKNEGNANNEKGDATEKISEETNSNFSTEYKDLSWGWRNFAEETVVIHISKKENFSQKETRI